jgi:Tol biopolymer transport system component
MMDERERLGRVLEGFAPLDSAFQRLVDRRDRKERNQRLAAGAVAIIVVLATGVFLAGSLTSNGVPADQPRPAPAPLGSLAYTLDGDVFVADGDGSNALKIVDGRSAEDCYGWSGEYWAEGPMWSPDGRYLAFRRFTDCGGEAPYPGNVVISDAEGNVLASFPAEGWDISWSPDSTRVAVWDRFPERIGVFGLDGGRQALLSMPDWWSVPGDVDPGWVPNGTSLFVDPDVELPLDGSAPRRLPGGAPNDPAGDADGFDIGVDHGALTIARSDGSESMMLVPAERGTELEAMAVSPEGDRVLFSKIVDGEPSLWSIGVDGSDPGLIVAGTTQGEWLLR